MGRLRMVPRAIFLTRGVGRHKEKLASFEEALRKAGIAHLNLVSVSSIFPPKCKVWSKKMGLTHFKPGQITYAVIAKHDTNENQRLVTASIGLAVPADRSQFGYLSEHHSNGMTELESGDYAEDLAATMLAATLGVPFNIDASWDEKKEIYKISGKIVNSRNITQSAVGKKGLWTSVIAAAVFVP
jgi:arginine decarboxylase